jgi:drug/metabolite transporter (DMT)-like permease
VRTSTVDAVADVSAGDAALLLYLGLLATLVGYILWNAGLRGLGPTRAVSYNYAISPLAVLIGAAVLDEPLSVYLGLGAALVIGGIVLVQRRSRGEPEARAALRRLPAVTHNAGP